MPIQKKIGYGRKIGVHFSGAVSAKFCKKCACRLLMSVCLPVRLSLCGNYRTGERIFMKFDIGEFYENLSTHSNFGSYRTTPGTCRPACALPTEMTELGIPACGVSPGYLGHLRNPLLGSHHPARQTPDTPPTNRSLTADNSDFTGANQNVKIWRTPRIVNALRAYNLLSFGFYLLFCDDLNNKIF
jgi:hypothetical protein